MLAKEAFEDKILVLELAVLDPEWLVEVGLGLVGSIATIPS